jgi:type I restriction enzyme, S subunit
MVGQWQTAKLGELVTFTTGKLDSNAAVPHGEYPFFTCSQETLRTNTYSFDTECVLLAGNNANGIFPLKYFRGRFDAYQRTYVITSRDTNGLTNRFLYYALRPKLAEFKSISTGAATKFLTLKILNETQISVPPASAQHQITSILAAYDNLIEVNQTRTALLEEMARRLFEEWFVHFRFPGHESVSIIDTPAGPLPQAWRRCTLAELCASIDYGYTAKSEPNGSGPKLLRITDIVPSSIDWTAVPHCQIEDSDAVKYSLREGDIVVARTGATVGYAKRINKLHPPSVFASYLVRFRLNPLVSNILVGMCIDSDTYKGQIKSRAGGAAQPNANAKVLGGVELLLPSDHLQKRFQAFAEPLFDLMETFQVQNSKLAAARDLLLPRLISGELSVSTAKRELETAA